jgi:hypothetical protein
MPVEIRELVIKINIEESNSKKGISAEELLELKRNIVKECIEKIKVKLDNQIQR